MSRPQKSADSGPESDWEFHSGRMAFNRASGAFFLLSDEGALIFRMVLAGARVDRGAAEFDHSVRPRPAPALRDLEEVLARAEALNLIQSGPFAATGKA